MKASLSGMGAVPYDGGATFRVWAPFASKVSVAGTFNAWRRARFLLARTAVVTGLLMSRPRM